MPSIRKTRYVKKSTQKNKNPQYIKLDFLNPGDVFYLEVILEGKEPKSFYYRFDPEMLSGKPGVNFRASDHDVAWLGKSKPQEVLASEMPPAEKVPRKKYVRKQKAEKAKKPRENTVSKPPADPDWRSRPRGPQVRKVLVFDSDGIHSATYKSAEFAGRSMNLPEQFIDFLCRSKYPLESNGFGFRYYRSTLKLNLGDNSISIEQYDQLSKRKGSTE